MGPIFKEMGGNFKVDNSVTSPGKEDVVKRKLVNISGSLYVCIPRTFVVHHKLKAGDVVPVILSASHIKVVPYEKINGSG